MIKNIKILQLKHDEEIRRNFLFESLDFLVRHNLSVSIDNYEVIYEEDIIVPDKESVYKTLENTFCRFQSMKPENYRGHSLSVSDIVSVDGVNYYCDRIGFKQI